MNKQIDTLSNYNELAPHLNCRLGINAEERLSLLASQEGPIIGVTDSGAAYAFWPDGKRAIAGSSAGCVLRPGHPAASTIRRLLQGLTNDKS